MTKPKTEAEVIIGWLEAQIEPRVEALLNGVETLPDYKYLCGIVYGLRMARAEILRRQEIYDRED